jgi:hypothetical protein
LIAQLGRAINELLDDLDRRGLILDPDAGRRQVGVAEVLQLLGKCGNGSLLAALPAQQHPGAHRC